MSNSKNVILHKKRNTTIYFLLRLSVVLIMISQALHGNFNNVFLCILTLILFLIPSIIDRKLHIELPNTLEVIILLFIYSAEILGEVRNYYQTFPYWDTMLHTLNGFLMGAIGFSLIDILNNNDRFHFKMSPIFVALIAFCFSMTVGVLWEFFEFSMDSLFRTDMQKDRVVGSISSVSLHSEGKNIPILVDDINMTVVYSNGDTTVIDNGYLDIGLIDTMKDLLVNCIGALVFSVFGLIYIKNRGKGSFVERFIPKKKSS